VVSSFLGSGVDPVSQIRNCGSWVSVGYSVLVGWKQEGESCPVPYQTAPIYLFTSPAHWPVGPILVWASFNKALGSPPETLRKY